MLRIMSTTLRIVIAVLALLFAGFYLLIDRLVQRVERQYLEAAEEPMVDAAHVVASFVEGTLKGNGTVDVDLLKKAWAGIPQREVKAKIYEVVKTTADMNVYVVDSTGKCIFDSRGIEEGEDLSSKRDVALTLAGAYGARSTRMNEDDDRSSVMYVGAPVRKDGQIVAAVSVIKPQRSMFEFIAQTSRVIATAGWSMMSVIGVGIVVLSWWLLRPLRKLKDYAIRVSHGERAALPEMAGSEAVALGSAFDAMKDALENRQYVETYIRGLTHEIKSPVAAIRGAAELAGEPQVTAEDRARFLMNISAECSRMQRVIDSLLALSELESRKKLENKEVINLGGLVAQLSEENRPAFGNKGVRLTFEAEINVLVRGDATLIGMAVENLLQNALDFTPGAGHVSVAIKKESNTAVLVVADSGAGIPDYALERVFERFYSLQRPTTGRKSSGLGLCIVKEVVELHGGEVRIANAPSGGVVARLSLPLA